MEFEPRTSYLDMDTSSYLLGDTMEYLQYDQTPSSPSFGASLNRKPISYSAAPRFLIGSHSRRHIWLASYGLPYAEPLSQSWRGVLQHVCLRIELQRPLIHPCHRRSEHLTAHALIQPECR